MINRREFILGAPGTMREIKNGLIAPHVENVDLQLLERFESGETIAFHRPTITILPGYDVAKETGLTLEHLDLRTTGLQIEPAVDDLSENITAVLPYVTGAHTRYRMPMGSLDTQHFISGRGTSTEVQAFISDQEYIDDIVPTTRYSTYAVVARYYDNKVVNASLAMQEMTKGMMIQGIADGETASYLSLTQIGELLRTKTLPGYAILGDLTRVNGGGICTSVTALARAARVFEHEQGGVDSLRGQAHSQRIHQYYFNPEDPTPQQIDRTAYYPSVDFTFRNTTGKDLFIVPKLNIVPDPDVPSWHNPLQNSSAWFVFSITLQDRRPTPQTFLKNAGQLSQFRRARGI